MTTIRKVVRRWVLPDIHIQSSAGVSCGVWGAWKGMKGAHSGSMTKRHPQWEEGKCFVMAKWQIAINFMSLSASKPTGIRLHAWDDDTKEADAESYPGYLQHDDRPGIKEPGPRDMKTIDVTELFQPLWHSDTVGSFQSGPYFKDNGLTGPRIHVSIVRHFFEETKIYSDDGRLLEIIEGRP